jgi:hypothetical protein
MRFQGLEDGHLGVFNSSRLSFSPVPRQNTPHDITRQSHGDRDCSQVYLRQFVVDLYQNYTIDKGFISSVLSFPPRHILLFSFINFHSE